MKCSAMRHARVPRQALLGILLLVVLGGVSVSWYVRRWMQTPTPPVIDVTGADPEVAAAIEAARAAVQQSPRSGATWGKLGQVLMAHEYYDEARVCFTRAEALDPKEARWPYLHGVTLRGSDNEAAVGQLQRAVELQGDAPALRLRLADALLSQERLDEADEQYRRLLALEPGHPHGQLGLGRLAYERGDFQTSRSYVEQAAGSSWTRKAAHTLLSEIAQHACDSDAAARERRLAADLPDDPDWVDPFIEELDQVRVGRYARLNRALLVLRRDGFGQGFPLLRALVHDYPEWDQAWWNYGLALVAQHDYAGAEDAARKALKASPHYVEAHVLLGQALFLRGEYAGAAQSFREATRLKPDHALAYYNLGHCLKRQGDQPGALEAFRAAARYKPNYGPAHTNLGELLVAQGDRTGALEHLKLAIELDPNDATARDLVEKIK